jgi:hypothetical protein
LYFYKAKLITIIHFAGSCSMGLDGDDITAQWQSSEDKEARCQAGVGQNLCHTAMMNGGETQAVVPALTLNMTSKLPV